MNCEKSYPLDAARQGLTESDPGTATGSSVAEDATLEAELTKRILPLHIHPDRMLPRYVVEAVELVYAPQTKIWFRIDAEKFVNELERRDPAYMTAVSLSWQNWGCGSFHEDLVNAIRTKAFDEFCASWLLSLPQGDLSDDDDEVYALLHSHLQMEGESVHLRYLELDGVKSVRHIRDKMNSIVS